MKIEHAPLIRPIRSDEYSAEARLLRAAYAAGPYGAELAVDEQWMRTEQDTSGRNRDGVVLVAVSNDNIIGTASLLRGGTEYAKLADAGEAELRLVAVAPEAQCRGIGEALVRSGLEEALRWGMARLRLDTGVRNPAQRLYERMGFDRTPDQDRVLDGVSYGDSLSYAYPLQGSEGVRVRLAAAHEYAAVGELALTAYRDDYEGLDDGYLASIADVVTRAAEHEVWVAEDTSTGALLGTITAAREGTLMTEIAEPGELDVRYLAVAHNTRGRGVGRLLMEHSIRLAGIRGAQRLVFETSPVMESAWRLYDRMGFERLTERDRLLTRDDGTQFMLMAYGSPIGS